MPERRKNSRISKRRSSDMAPLISTIADIVNSQNKGRANFPALQDIAGMTDAWRERLKEALAQSALSMRDVSKRAGCSAGYLYSILEEGKEPTLARIVRIADALEVSLPWLLYGTLIGPQEEQLLRLYAKLPEKQRQALLDLASTNDKPNPS